MIDLDLPVDAQARVHRFCDYWDARRGDRPRPSRADIDPLDIPDLLPFVTLVDVHRASPRFVYRLVGTEAARLFGRDLTGQPVGTGVKPDELEDVLTRYRRVADDAACIYQRVMMQEETNDYTLVERVMLPLGAPSGEVNMIFGLVAPRPPDN